MFCLPPHRAQHLLPRYPGRSSTRRRRRALPRAPPTTPLDPFRNPAHRPEGEGELPPNVLWDAPVEHGVLAPGARDGAFVFARRVRRRQRAVGACAGRVCCVYEACRGEAAPFSIGFLFVAAIAKIPLINSQFLELLLSVFDWLSLSPRIVDCWLGPTARHFRSFSDFFSLHLLLVRFPTVVEPLDLDARMLKNPPFSPGPL